MRLTHALIVSLALFGLSSPVAHAQQIWGELDLPGGVAAARQVANLGRADDRPDAIWLLDFARKYAPGEYLDRNVQRLATYLQAIAYLQEDLEQWPDGIVLPTTETPREERARLELLFDSVGLSLRLQDRQYRLQLDGSERARERRALLERVNVDVDGLAAALNSGARVKIPIPHSRLPLPLPDWWKAEVFSRAAAQGSFVWSAQGSTVPLLAVVRSPPAAFTYLGLMASDAETLGFLAGRPAFVSTLRDGASGAFAAFSRSLRVRQGVVELPGGADTSPLWASLVGRASNDPERFLLSLLAADNGRLAYFYDTVASLAPSRQAFVLGMHLSPGDRAAFVRRIYRKFVDIAPAWNISKSPLERPTFDPAIVLQFVETLPDGSVGPAWWPALLTQVFTQENWPGEEGTTPRVSSPTPANAAWLVEWLFADPSQIAARFGVLRFAQRMFPAIEAGQSKTLEVALRARKDMPALALALERMNVRDSTRMVALASAARRLTLAGTYDQAAPGLRRWQGALALVERMHLSAAWPPAQLAALLDSLAQLVPDKGTLPPGTIAAWLTEQLLPVLTGRGPIESERQFLERLMGLPPQREESFTWEGLRYSARPHAVTIAGALAIRRSRPGPQLQDLVQLQGARRQLGAGGYTPEGLRAVTAALVALEPAMAALPRVEGKAPVMAVEFKGALTALNRISTSDTGAQSRRELPPLVIALDAVTDAIVPSICYALAASPIDAPETVSEAWTLHSFIKLKNAAANQLWRQSAWQLPASEVRSQGGTAVVGALVTLDVAFAQSKLVRLPSPDFPAPEWLSELDAKYLTQALVLVDGEADDAAFQGALDALATGRKRVAAWTMTPPAPEELTAALETARVDPVRTNVIAWTASRQASRAFDALTLTELFRLGGGRALPPSSMGAAMPLDGCLCRVSNEPRRVDDLRGRRGGLRATLLTDLKLRLAEVVHGLGLPLDVVPLLVPMGTQDWLDQAKQLWMDDWEAVARWPARLSSDRVEAYLLHLVSSGILSPPLSEQGQR